MYENKRQPLLSRKLFIKRLLKHFLVTSSLFLFSLGIGIFGYRIFMGFSWIDSLLNASMILGGMGVVNVITTESGKLFASFYSLFSGIIFVACASIIIAPVLHRILHRLELEEEA